MTISSFTVTVPATTANLGAGFDCIGAALTLYNRFRFSPGRGTMLSIHVAGAEAESVTTDESNLVYQAFLKLYHHINQPPPPVSLHIEMDVPLARGLGSSATAIVGGLLGANQMAGSPLSPADVAELAIAIEGHPDNVVPALLGGCRLTATNAEEDASVTCDIPWHSDFVPVLGIPDFELSTAEARLVLPTEYARADAIFNAAHLGLLIRALASGNGDWLQAALHDRIHQPYRETLIHGYKPVRQAALAAGAYGLVISGAGPTLLAIASPTTAADVAAAMTQAWLQTNVKPQVKILQLDSKGARIEVGS